MSGSTSFGKSELFPPLPIDVGTDRCDGRDAPATLSTNDIKPGLQPMATVQCAACDLIGEDKVAAIDAMLFQPQFG